MERLRGDLAPRVIGRRPEHAAGSTGSVGRAVYWRDRLFSRHGIDVRCPLMDRRVLEFLYALPVSQVHSALEDRTIIRRAMQGWLPDSIRTRTSKTGFLGYVEAGLRLHADAMVDAFRSPLLADLGAVDPTRLCAAASAFRDGKRKGYDLWMPLTLERWLRRHGDELRNVTA